MRDYNKELQAISDAAGLTGIPASMDQLVFQLNLSQDESEEVYHYAHKLVYEDDPNCTLENYACLALFSAIYDKSIFEAKKIFDLGLDAMLDAIKSN